MHKQPTPNRLEAFSDGVIAVIITIMVLDLKIPHADGLAGFVTVLPTIAVYLLSFLLTGLYWLNHHVLIDRLRHVDALILWANLFFLFTLSLIPFFTNYLVEKGIRPFPVGLYAASLFVDAISWTLLAHAISRHLCLHADDPEEAAELAEQLAEFRKGLICLGTYLVAIAVARYQPLVALVLVALINLVWVVPGFLVKPTPLPHHPHHPHPTHENQTAGSAR
jgi:uncharacterized membrane protein